ncbi:MAG: response regulator [Patescibacteria group bacterium]
MADAIKKILLIEDDPFLSSLLKTKLQKQGFEIIWAADGEIAMEILKKTDIDLILLDIILPKKTGFEVLEEMRMDPQLQSRKTPVMIISNLGQEEDIERGKNLGVIEYFIKAKVSIDDLAQKVKDFFKQ